MLSCTALAQKTVAVYVTASEGVPQETKRILGSELVAAITRNPDYVAIERTNEFLSQVSQEQGRYNNIDDKKLFELGQKYGASNVCVAEITKFGDEYYIVSRLLDIKTQRVWKTARKSSELKTLGELMSVSEAVADELVGNTKEFSTYAYGDNSSNQSFITKIENRDNYTKVTFKFISTSPTQSIGIYKDTYIEDLVTHNKYVLKDVSNINIIDTNNKNFKIIGKGIWEYSLFFDRISEETKNIKIIEPIQDGRAYMDIVLKPYGNDNTFVFEDNTQKLYDELTKQYSGELQLEEGKYIGDIVDGKPNGQGIMYYKDDSYGRIKYEGEWKNGVIIGYGVMTYIEGRYEGTLTNGEPNGQGIFWYNNGDKMEGSFIMKNNVLNGNCVYTTNDGIAIYNIVDGKPDGEVIFKTADGNVLKAQFSKGKQKTDWR